MRFHSLLLCTAALVFTSQLNLSAGHAADHFLTIGGGYSPSGNQISLEKNVQFFQRLLAEKNLNNQPHDIYFADGDAPGRDLQYNDPTIKVPQVNTLLARVFKKESGLKYLYRDHQLNDIQGASSRTNIKKWFETKGSKLQAGDRLFVYVTAHGGRGGKKTQQNTKLYLWNTKSILMSEFTSYLDKVPNEVQVVVVMVQCYSGGYSNIIFNQGNSKKGFTKANRCGFYATVHNRVAAGCTPDINEANYQEYSSHFWAAILGKDRVGKSIPSADYNRDGNISLDEAHAYALIVSDTIDISIKTSDAFLRAFSKTKVKGTSNLLTAYSPYPKLYKLATSSEKAVLKSLSKELKLNATAPAKEAKKIASKINKEKKALLAKRRKDLSSYNKVVTAIRNSLLLRWPEMKNSFSPRAIEFITNESDAIVAAIKSHPNYKKMDKLHRSLQQSSKKKLDLDRRWVKCQRMIRCLENIALAANLPHLADKKTQERYQRLLQSETQPFTKLTKPQPVFKK